jgi:integrase
MPRVNLTVRTLENLKRPERPGQRIEYFDDTVPGFGVRVTHEGHKTFTFLYRLKAKKCRINLGTYPPLGLKEAREAAKLAWAEVQRGSDPRGLETSDQRTSTEGGCTFEGLCQQYLAAADGGRRLRASSTLPHYAQLIKAEIASVFGSRHPGEITRSDVREWSERLGEAKPVVANRAFSVMRRVYSWALGRDLVASTPFVGIHKPAIEMPRDRVLTPDELVKVFAALRYERPIIAALWELLFYTGVRPGTALRAHWTDMKLDRKVWEVPVTKRARGNPEGVGRPFVVPLSPQAVAVLDLLRPFAAHSDFVFPGGSPRRASLDSGRSLFSPQKSIQRMRERTGIKDFMMRDIRRTVATGLAELGVPANIISKVMDHTLPGESPVTPIYSRYAFLDEKRKALDSWGCHLEGHLRSQLPARSARGPSGGGLAAVLARRQRGGA